MNQARYWTAEDRAERKHRIEKALNGHPLQIRMIAGPFKRANRHQRRRELALLQGHDGVVRHDAARNRQIDLAADRRHAKAKVGRASRRRNGK